MLLMQFGNMGKDLAKYNTKLFAEKVMPQLTRRLFGMGGPLVAAADDARRAGAADAIPAIRRWRRNECTLAARIRRPSRKRGPVTGGEGRLPLDPRFRGDRGRQGAFVSEPEELSVDLNGFSCRVWRKGQGPKLGFLAGFGGLPRWIPFLDALARERTVIVPSLPGFPGGDRGHTVLDSHLDWLLAVRQLLLKAGLDGADLAGSSVGGSFAAEVAAIWPAAVRRLALIAPWGLFDEKDPMTDPWAQRAPDVPGLLCADPERWNQLKAEPEGANSPEWPIVQTRANEAAARAFWPLGNTRLEKRLPLIEAPTLLIWGERRPHHAAQLRRPLRRRDCRAHRNHHDPRRRPSRRTRQTRRGRRGNPALDGVRVLEKRQASRSLSAGLDDAEQQRELSR